MNINEYISEIESIIHSSSIVASYILNIDRKAEDIVFISGRIDFRDGSIMDFKEFVESTNIGINKLKYGYNYRMGSEIMFRYDNAPDPRARKLKSFPCHKHIQSGEIIESKEANLAQVLEEIESAIIDKW